MSPNRSRTGALIMSVFALVGALSSGSAATAHAAAATTAFDDGLQVAFKACVADTGRDGGREFDPNAFYSCLGARGYSAVAHAPAGPADLTTRTPTPTRFEIDLFSTFTACLAEAAHGDSMYPGIHPREVNQCLEAHGAL